MQKYLLYLFFFFLLGTSWAQEIPQNYLKAKTSLDEKNYRSALQGFAEFLDLEKYGNLSFYASLYSAEAAYYLKEYSSTLLLLGPIQQKSWEKSDEVHYLASLTYFQLGQHLEALNELKLIKAEHLVKQGYNASFNFLQKVSPSFLITHLEQFKQNDGYTAALAFVLQQKSVMTQVERNVLNQVIRSGVNQDLKDKTLDMVLILPFTSGPDQLISTKEALDFTDELYQGIRLRISQLQSQGVPIKLHTFDSKRDTIHLLKLLKDPIILGADVILGPIYPEETELISAFAETQQIPFIHPLSNLGDRFESAQYSYLFRPSVPSLAQGILSSLRSQAWGKSVAIGYSGNSRDEKLAYLLQEHLPKAGFSIQKFQKIDSKNAASFLQGLGVRRGNKPSVQQIILLSDDPAIAQPVFSLMESISTSLPLLVMDSWLSFNFSNYEMLEFSNFYFISNNTPNYNSQELNDFRESYYESYLFYPPTHAILGAELVNWIYKNADYGYNYELRASLDQKSFQPGELTWGFNFQKVNNNTYTPVFKLEAGELIPLQ